MVTSVYGSQFFVIRGIGSLKSFTVPTVSESPIFPGSARPSGRALQVNDIVHVTGDVLHFNRESIKSRIDGRFTTHAYDRYMDRGLIAADSVTIDLPSHAPGSLSYHRRQLLPDVIYLITKPRITDMVGESARLTRVRILNQ